MQQSGLIWLLFGYRGRISRSQFWMAPAIYLGGLLVSLILSAVFTWLLFVIYFAALVVSSLMVGIKRLHDRNKGDWWAIFFFIVPIALNGRMNGWSLGGQLGETADTILHFVATAISLSSAACAAPGARMPMDSIHSTSGQSERESRIHKDTGIARLFQL